MNDSNMNGYSAGTSGFGNNSQSQTYNSNAFSGSGSSGFSGSRSGMGMQTISNKITGLTYQEAKMKSTTK
jgi:hypothetical protein